MPAKAVDEGRANGVSYVEAPQEWQGAGAAVFLAGGITGCPDWQRDARALLEDEAIVVLNPRRADFPIDDPSAAHEQIDWEFRHLQRASVVLFWFAQGPAVQPIALYELGRHAALGRALAVGCHPDYPRVVDVRRQLALARPEIAVHDALGAVCEQARTIAAMAVL